MAKKDKSSDKNTFFIVFASMVVTVILQWLFLSGSSLNSTVQSAISIFVFFAIMGTWAHLASK